MVFSLSLPLPPHLQLLLAAGSTSPAALWFGVAALGACVAPIFPATLVCAEQYVEMAPNVATLLVVGASAGEMIVPGIAAALVPAQPDALWKICVVSCAVALGAFVALQRFGTLRSLSSSSSSTAVASEDEEEHVAVVVSQTVDVAAESAAIRSAMTPRAPALKAAPAANAQSRAPAQPQKQQQAQKQQQPQKQQPQQQQGKVVVSAAVDTRDPNIDWVEYDRLYGPSAAATAATAVGSA